jgi:hypothetical protein
MDPTCVGVTTFSLAQLAQHRSFFKAYGSQQVLELQFQRNPFALSWLKGKVLA